MDYSSDRCSNILAVASHVEAHAHTRIEVRPFADGTVTASWRPIGMLRPAISLAHEPVAVAELNALVVSARAEREREAAARAVGDRANRPKPPRHERADKDRKRPRDGPRRDTARFGLPRLLIVGRREKPKYRFRTSRARLFGSAMSTRPSQRCVRRWLTSCARAARRSRAYLAEARCCWSSLSLWVRGMLSGSRVRARVDGGALPRIWHCEGGESPIHPSARRLSRRSSALTEHHRSHATHLTRETQRNGIMRVAGKPTGAPAFARS